MTRPSIGQQVAVHRRLRGLTQRQLALRLHRSVSWVTKVERGERALDSVTVLLQVAAALGVDVKALTGRPFFPEPGGRGGPISGEGVVQELRGVLMRYDAIHGGLPGDRSQVFRPFAAFRSDARTARRLYDGSPSNFSSVVHLLPGLVTEGQQRVREGGDDARPALPVLVDLYRLTAMELRQYGELDLAWIAADRALLTAQRTGDLALVGACAGTLVHQMTAQGCLREAVALALAAARALEVHDAAPPALWSVWGALHLFAALAAARDGDGRASADLLTAAHLAADRNGRDRNDHATHFGPTNVALQDVGVLVDLGRPAAALGRAAAMPEIRLPSVNRRCYHHLHLVRAHAMLRHDSDTLQQVLAAEEVAPEIVRWDPLSRELVRGLLIRSRRGVPDALRALAQRTDLARA